MLDTNEGDVVVADDPLAWVAAEPESKMSCFLKSASDALDVPKDRAEGAPANWVLQIPRRRRRICSSFPGIIP